MTLALCFNCGAIKVGALNPCQKCMVGSTSNPDLDIAFSDHRLSKSTLEDFGSVIRQIKEVCSDDQTRFWTFISYVSENYPAILTCDVKPEMATQVRQVLTGVQLPQIAIQEVGKAHDRTPSTGRNEGEKKWWQFWR